MEPTLPEQETDPAAQEQQSRLAGGSVLLARDVLMNTQKTLTADVKDIAAYLDTIRL